MIEKEEFWNKVSKMLKMQKALDKRILEEKGLNLSDFELFELTRTALIVEVSEATNVAEFFKHWKDTRGNKADGDKTHEETLKEEFSDALHFLLSMINQATELNNNLTKDDQNHIDNSLDFYEGTEAYINKLYKLEFEGTAKTLMFNELIYLIMGVSRTSPELSVLFTFIDYANACGVTFDDLYDAYMIKNKVNYERLESGY